MSSVLVFGASGYVGSNLAPFLAVRGHAVRATARRRAALEARCPEGVDLCEADALVPRTLDAALAGIEVAYYLVHSMAAGREFPRIDREAARNFRDAAAKAGVRRIVYLGGVLPAGEASPHLRSRAETGAILREGPVPVTELRAGVIIGPGSAAFEVIRDLVFHLPVMVTPRWVRSRSEPIALGDVLEYLAQLPSFAEAAGAIYDVGGPEVLTYEQLMRQFGELVGRAPYILPVPVLTPRLSSYWLDLVTAVPSSVARELIEGLEHDIIADDSAIRALIPQRLQTYREAAVSALEAERGERSSQRWAEGSMIHRRSRVDFAFYAKRMSGAAVAQASRDDVWRVISAIGGSNGYYFADALWEIRGHLDRMAGGTGLRRGRRDPDNVVVGDAIDFWRVAAVEPGRRLTLLAEMRVPGSATLEFELQPRTEQCTSIEVTAYFHPAGAPGLLYWHSLGPVHAVMFNGLARAIARRAEQARARGTSDFTPSAHRR